MIDRHWDGIAAYCQPENKVALGFVEGLNNKIRDGSLIWSADHRLVQPRLMAARDSSGAVPVSATSASACGP